MVDPTSSADLLPPLSAINVLELAGGIAGPYAGKLLAGFGADVIKVEPPTGDPARTFGPFPLGEGPEQSATFAHLNTRKRSVVTDDPVVLDNLVRWADVVIHSEAEEREHVDHWRAINPQLVVLSVTAFGLTGPYAQYQGEEIVHIALGGPLSASGMPDREPVKMGADLGQYQCGTIAAVAALGAVLGAEQHGIGTHIDLANTETQLSSIDRRMTYLLYRQYRGQDVERRGGYSVSALPGGCRPTQDGHVQISTLINWIPRMLSVVDEPVLAEMYDNPAWIVDEALPEVADAMVVAWAIQHTRQEAMEIAQSQGWPVTAVNRPIDLLTDPHFAARKYFDTIEHPVLGSFQVPGAPVRMEHGWVAGPVPMLGEHTAEVEEQFGSETRPPSTSRPATTSKIDEEQPLPLEGIRVLDMTVVWAGPYSTMLLGDLGADVVRVDNPYIFPSATRGLMARPPKDVIAEIGGIFGGYPDAEPGDRPWNRVALFNAHARNKRSVTLDLRKDLGREAFLRLVEECDVMVENNSVELLDKLGIGWDVLHERNPRLILVRMPSVGLEGPYRDYLGFGVNFEALVGLGAIRGYQDADLTDNEPVFHMDAASGSAGALAALAALRRRQTTGRGELVEVSQAENMINHIGELVVDADLAGTVHERIGNRHRWRAPQGVYPCQGSDAWAAVSVGNAKQWAALCRLLGREEWASDDRFLSNETRMDHHDEIDVAISAWTTSLSPGDVFSHCQEAGIPAAPVLHEGEAYVDPHFQARGMFRSNGSDDTGQHLYPNHLWHWDGPAMKWGPLPIMGGDNEAVFRDLLGFSDEDYQALDADGHLSTAYLGPDGTPL